MHHKVLQVLCCKTRVLPSETKIRPQDWFTNPRSLADYCAIAGRGADCIQNKAERQREKTKRIKEQERNPERTPKKKKKEKKTACHRLCRAEIPSLSSLAGEQAGSHNGQQIPPDLEHKGWAAVHPITPKTPQRPTTCIPPLIAPCTWPSIQCECHWLRRPPDSLAGRPKQ